MPIAVTRQKRHQATAATEVVREIISDTKIGGILIRKSTVLNI
jgi:hypothetical protein